MSAESKFSFRAWSNILPTKPPEALIEGILLRGRLGVIFAKPDHGKTFVGLGMSLSVGTGELFAGRAVLKGPTIYIAAEGEYDLEQRVPAWRKLHTNAGEPEGGCYGQEVNFFDYDKNGNDEVSEFIRHLNGAQVELLVIDTLAAVMIGGDEDRAKDMNILINNVKRVMKATGCAALIIHHAGWETNREKGSIALRAAADVVIETTLGEEKPDGSRIVTLTCRKMKSMRKFEPFGIALVQVDVVTPRGTFKSLAIGHPITVLDEVFPSETENHGRHIVRVMLKHFSEQGATNSQLLERSGMRPSKFNCGLNCATKEKDWLVGGGGRGLRYKLNPNNSWKAAIAVRDVSITSLRSLHPYRGVEVKQSDQVTLFEASSKLVRSESDPGIAKAEKTAQPAKAGTDPVAKVSELLRKVEI